MNLQKNQESTKEHNSKFQKLKFVVTSVSSCQYKFSNIAKYLPSQKKTRTAKILVSVNQSLQRQTLLSVSKSMRKMGLTEIQKQTIAQRLRDGISIRAIAAEVGVDKGTVLLAKQKMKPMHT
jgi:DNA-binding NarL/FixJ family response regulator